MRSILRSIFPWSNFNRNGGSILNRYQQLTSSRCGALPNFGDLIRKLDVLLENQNKYLPLEQLEKSIPRELDSDSVVGFMFLNQAYQIRKINELLITFEFLNSCKQEFRQKLLNFSKPEFEIDMLVAGAWLSEHKAGTIDSSVHSSVFARLEEFAKSWNQDNLAVCCRKFRAIIIDEYGNDKNQALAALNEGLSIYGETNSELVRAKAKVLYRAADHQGSLELSKGLIEGNAPLSKTEKAFLGREAAISAENQGNFETARSYYLYGSNAAGNCSIPDMVPMKIGLMADAALASWHSGDREICLRDFVIILQELVNIDPKSSLRAAHCHALCRHVLLWLDQEATGKKHLHADGAETRIYPGVVSNPEPHSEIGKQYITPIEIAWYMLATLENNCCLDVGITQNLVAFLPKGPVLNGQLCLTPSKMKKAITLHDTALFITAMKETVAELIYFKEQGKNSLDYKNVTYGMFPVPTLEQQISTSDLTELFVLCFISNCIFAEEIDNLDYLVTSIEKNQDFKVKPEFIESLRGHGSETNYNTSVANLLAIHWCAIDKKETQLPPSQVFKLAFQAIQIASQTKTTSIVTKPIFEWLSKKWVFIWDCQRFLLKLPAFYEKSIDQMLSTEGQASITKLIDLLQAILPTMGFINESELYDLLNNIRNQNSELS